MFNPNHTSSYRRLFKIVSKDMQNWKEKITICIDTDDMRGATQQDRMLRAVKRMGKIRLAVEFMVAGKSIVNVYDNAEGNGRTLVLRNAGYYVNVGA